MHGKIYRAQKKEAKAMKNSVRVVRKGNYATVKGYSTRIQSEEDFYRELNIDTDKWIVLELRIKTWEGYRKDVDQMMDFDEGRITGYKRDHGKINTETMTSIEAKMVLRQPEPVEPLIVPVSLKAKAVRPTKGKKVRLGQDLYIADPHFGFSMDPYGKLEPLHDRRALSIILSLLEDYEFENIILAGDTLDLAEWSTKFPRKPELFRTTQPAIFEARWFITQIKVLAPNSNIFVLEGNHDQRIEKLLVQHAWQMLELTRPTELGNVHVWSIPFLLTLDEIGVEYIGKYPDSDIWINNKLYLHGRVARGKSGATAVKVAEDAIGTTGYGHIHRRELVTKTVWTPTGRKEIAAFSPGCLCHVDGRVPGVSGKPNWQQGFAVITGDTPVITPIDEGSALYNNQVYEAWDYVDDLRAISDWNF